MSKKKYTSGVWKFLEESGVLKSGNSNDIAQKRKEYWTERKRLWKQEKRKQEKEFKIYFTKEELSELTKTAGIYKMSKTRFIKQAILAYLRSGYVVPNIEALHKVRTMLSINYSALQELLETEKLPYATGIELLAKMDSLEQAVMEQLLNRKST